MYVDLEKKKTTLDKLKSNFVLFLVKVVSDLL